MMKVKTFCCCYSLKTGSHTAAVLFMIYSLCRIVGHGLIVGWAASERKRSMMTMKLMMEQELISNSIELFVSTLYLIFSIKVIMAIKKEDKKDIGRFVLLLFYLYVRTCVTLFYSGIYMFCGYSYNLLQVLLLKPAFMCVTGYFLCVVVSFYSQLRIAKKTENNNDIPVKNEKEPIPA